MLSFKEIELKYNNFINSFKYQTEKDNLGPLCMLIYMFYSKLTDL